MICLFPIGLGLRLEYSGQPETAYYDYKSQRARPLTSNGLYWTGGLLLGLYGVVYFMNVPHPSRKNKAKSARQFGKQRRQRKE